MSSEFHITVFVKLLSGDLLTVAFDSSRGLNELYRVVHFNMYKDLSKDIYPIWCMHLFPLDTATDETDETDWIPKDGDTIGVLIRSLGIAVEISRMDSVTNIYHAGSVALLDHYSASLSFIEEGETRTVDIEFYSDRIYHNFIECSNVERVDDEHVRVRPLDIIGSATTIRMLLHQTWEETELASIFPSDTKEVVIEKAEMAWSEFWEEENIDYDRAVFHG